MKNKRLLVFALIMILVATLSTAYAAKKPVVVKFAVNAYASELPGWTAMVDAANKKLAEKNIVIEMQKIPASNWGEYYQKVITQMAAGMSPDIGRIAESYMPIIINKGQVVDLTAYINTLDKDKYFAATFEGSNYVNGRYYGLPSGVYYMVMYFNKDLFDQKGIPYPSQDWNNSISFSTVREYASKLTAGEGANKTFGFYSGPYLAHIGMYSLSNGGQNIFNPDGTCAIGEQASREVYKWFDDMLRVDKSMPRPTDTRIMGAFDMFRAGRLAMLVEGTWMHGAVKQIDNFNVGIAAVPSGLGKAYSSMFVDHFVIWKGSKKVAESWEALKALYSKEAFDALAAHGVGGTPIHRETMEKIKDLMIGDVDEADKNCFIAGLDHTLGVPYNENYEETDQKINATMDEWLLGTLTYDQYVDKVIDIINQGAGR